MGLPTVVAGSPQVRLTLSAVRLLPPELFWEIEEEEEEEEQRERRRENGVGEDLDRWNEKFHRSLDAIQVRTVCVGALVLLKGLASLSLVQALVLRRPLPALSTCTQVCTHCYPAVRKIFWQFGDLVEDFLALVGTRGKKTAYIKPLALNTQPIYKH